MRIQGGIPVGGNLSGVDMLQAGNPFGPGFVIPKQGTSTPGTGPQLFNLPQTPTRIFSPSDFDRENAIPVKFRQAGLQPGMAPAGNAGYFLAQAAPVAPNGLGGPLTMSDTGPGMPQQPNVFSFRPSVQVRDEEQGGLGLGGSLNIPIGRQGRINVQGEYQPGTSNLNLRGTIGQPPGSQGFGIDFGVNRRLNRPAMPGMFGGGMVPGIPSTSGPQDDMYGILRASQQF
jgi:hypothetical protein